MEIAWGVGYLLVVALIAVLGLPFVLVAEKVWGRNDERTGAIYGVVALAVACWLMFS